ncbi:MAG: hypothetical protein GWM90_26395, partial [Gemmatimonadetes bacterium]|nr:hypothetical protein [Gemmatimonadota bacterium]NIQ58416.1 hypothetical protein [Gemmatimonadota bacterium]NIU78627.1 hypothetical protein [Gammaproteobacteria bacterium]NIX47470.1 hypothetical protein [Gemmatimonadota bacterium]NIY11853.1 hypothetical protein [Gemmatimonadota bacterium]
MTIRVGPLPTRAPAPLTLFTILGLSLLVGCSDGALGPGDGQLPLQLHADVAGTATVALEVRVSAPDLPTAMRFTAEPEAGIVASSLGVPAGTARTVEVR